MASVLAQDLEIIGPPSWDTLVAASPGASVFQSRGWISAWWKARRAWNESPGEPLVVTVEHGGALRALVPFVINSSDNRRTLRFMADRQSPAMDVVCAASDPSALAQLLESLWEERARWDAISLRGMPANSATLPALEEWAARHGLVSARTRGEPYDVMSLRPNALAPVALGASRDGLVVTHEDDPTRIAARLNQFFGQHIRCSGTREAPSRFVERWQRDFARHVTEELGPTRGVVLSTAFAGKAPVAMQLGLVFGSQAWFYEPSIEVFSTVAGAPGALLRSFAALVATRGVEEICSGQSGTLAALGGSVSTRDTVSLSLTRPTTSGGASRVRRIIGRTGVARRLRPVLHEAGQLSHAWRHASNIVAEQRKKMEVAETHRDFYDVGSVLRQYVRTPRLLKPEFTILHELRAELRDMRVLDVAVGAGRTTPYLATLAREYRAYDYATKMVDACRQIMGDLVPAEHITCDDARDMRTVATASCEFILISYNGIDTVGPEPDRIRVLNEVRRVGVAGGYLAFSAHNMKGLTPTWSGEPGLAAAHAPTLPARLRHWRRYVLLRAANPNLGQLRRQPAGMVLDSGGEYAFPHYYITAAAQIRQLEELGFHDVRVFSANTGAEITDSAMRDSVTDSWLHYLCRI